MKISKSKLVNIPAVYVTADLKSKNKTYYIVASEDRGEKAYIIDADTLETRQLYDGPTGVMNIVQVPEEERLIGITGFYPVFQCRGAQINEIMPSSNNLLAKWIIRPVLDLPYCHRIGSFKNKNGKFLLACTLCKDKNYNEDWSMPGSVYITKIPKSGCAEWKLVKQYDGLVKNHGLWFDGATAYVTAQNGILKFDLSDYKEGQVVTPEIISTTPTGDICVSDNYYATIEPFHGNNGALYDKSMNLIKHFDIDFGHSVWVGRLFDSEYMILAERGGAKNITLHDLNTGEKFVLDSGVGPTQISVFDRGDEVDILSANHGAGNVYLYILIK